MEKRVVHSVYYDDNDIKYDMVECYYDDFFVYVIDYDHLSHGHFNLEKIYEHMAYDVPHHAIPVGMGYGDNMWLVDYAYYLDFHPQDQ